MAMEQTITKESIQIRGWNEDTILDTLQHELLELKDKIESARKREDYGTYKNLILAFKEVVHLIHEEEEKTTWKDMSSKYKTDGKDMISLWEQKGKDIRNIKKYVVVEDLSNKPTYNLYYDLECRDDNLFKCTIYFKDKILGIVGDCSYIATYITSLCYEEKVNIYGDIRAFGIALADILKEVGYVVKPTTMVINDVTKDIIGKEIKQDYSKTR